MSPKARKRSQKKNKHRDEPVRDSSSLIGHLISGKFGFQRDRPKFDFLWVEKLISASVVFIFGQLADILCRAIWCARFYDAICQFYECLEGFRGVLPIEVGCLS